ncbi:junctional adhesion molecule A-like [Brienomyrus brachyistius]|uniref:junctional adhesion molecule A-like n=1 Tax=Brienomyrus brachyistius TaxID=42636 RepID=UPI0020B440EF|nr:junctional adhesion molecule A-like [Brienomyrus brachyistius]
MLFVVVLTLCLQATGTFSQTFSVTTSDPNPSVPENSGVQLKCAYSSDFGTPRVEWKFKNMQGSQGYVVYDNKPTEKYVGRIDVYNGGLTFNKVTRQDNGDYSCEVSGNNGYGEVQIKLTVQVPPSVPMCGIPSTVTTGTRVVLTCLDKDGSPPSTYKWYKNGTPMPEDPSKFNNFKNSTYSIHPQIGHLTFANVAKLDSGDYYCTATNGIGSPQSCASMRMEVKDLNTGGIVAGVLIALLAVALLIFGLWFARRKGYLPRKSTQNNKLVYAQPAANYHDDADGEFKQKSSFVV